MIFTESQPESNKLLTISERKRAGLSLDYTPPAWKFKQEPPRFMSTPYLETNPDDEPSPPSPIPFELPPQSVLDEVCQIIEKFSTD